MHGFERPDRRTSCYAAAYPERDDTLSPHFNSQTVHFPEMCITDDEGQIVLKGVIAVIQMSFSGMGRLF